MHIRTILKPLLGTTILVATLSAGAQAASTGRELPGSFGIAGTYQTVHANTIAGQEFWMQGASAEADMNVVHGLGIALDASALHTPHMVSGGAGERLVTLAMGPRFGWGAASHRLSIFGQGLVGGAIGFNSEIPKSTIGAQPVGYGLATVIGGGVSWYVSPRVRLRAVEANWVRTQVPNSTTDVQNNLRLGTGLEYRFR